MSLLIRPVRTERYPNMHSAGLQAIARLRRFLNDAEVAPERRERLFTPFWGPRAAFIKRLTGAVLSFVVGEGTRLRSARVLDYGCGVMPYKRAFEYAGATVLGADIGEGRTADLRIGGDGRVPVDEAVFDYVISVQVLEHVPVPGAYLDEAYRMLKPGGRLFLTTHGTWPYHPTPLDLHRWTRAGLLRELEQSGFETERMWHILNEYSAAVQSFVMTGEYRGVWGRFGKLIHFLTHGVILVLEELGRYPPDCPVAFCVVCRKPQGDSLAGGGDT